MFEKKWDCWTSWMQGYINLQFVKNALSVKHDKAGYAWNKIITILLILQETEDWNYLGK